jgi:hypothetical protein
LKTHEIVLLQGAQSDLLSIYQTLGGNHIRRLVVSKTPLGVFYALAGRRVLVAAILDLRQSPESIQKRLTSQ